MKKSIIILLIFSIFISCLMTGCVAAEEKQPDTSSEAELSDEELLAELSGKKIGCLIGGVHDTYVSAALPDAEIDFFDSLASELLALKANRIDAYANDHPIAIMQLKKTEGAKILCDIPGSQQDWAIALAKDNYELKEKLDRLIIQYREDGTLDRLEQKWVISEDSQTQVCEVDQDYDAPNGTLNVYCYSGVEGFVYVYNGQLVGYEVELLLMLAKELGYKCNLIDSPFYALIPSLESGKSDLVIGTLTVTEERQRSVLFTEPDYHCSTALICRSDDVTTNRFSDFLKNIKTSFTRTFIEEDRWKMIGSGLLVTLIISVVSIVCGTIVGFFYSFLLRSKLRIIKNLAYAFSNIIDGIPIIVLLMLLYYVIFRHSPLSAAAVATVGFTLDFANSTALLINTGALAVSVGQCEAAKTLGFTKWETFTGIVFPQIVRQMFEAYKSRIVNLVKGTAVVGYITVEDLTHVSDIIRSRTYEALFPLLASAFIYFLLSRGLISFLKVVEKNIDPKRRKNVLKGVVLK